MNWFPFPYILDNLITNSIHAWLTKDYRSSGMIKANFNHAETEQGSSYAIVAIWHLLRVGYSYRRLQEYICF